MAHVIFLTDGANTVYLNGGSPERIITHNYTPQVPGISVTEAEQAISDGADITQAHLLNVTETLELLITDTTLTNLQTAVNSIEQMLQRARYRQQSGTERPVYLVVQWAGETHAWRSEIFHGQLALTEQSLLGVSVQKMEARLHITRRFYWERNTVADITLTSQVTSGGSTTGTRIRNHWDGTQSNWVSFVTTDPGTGSIPTPIRLRLQNRNSASLFYRNIYIGNYVVRRTTDNTNIAIALQAEDSTVTGTNTTDANSSGGNYRATTWAGATDGEKYRWAITTAELLKAGGRYFRVLARLANTVGINSTAYISLQVKFLLTTIYETAEIKLTSPAGPKLLDLGMIQLPPALSRVISASNSPSELTLSLSVRDSQAGGMNLDFVQIMPTDSWRHLRQPGYQLADTSMHVDDGTEGAVYVFSSSTGTISPALIDKGGRHILAWPGRDQRIYVLHDEGTEMNISRQYDVYASYRPRRLTI